MRSLKKRPADKCGKSKRIKPFCLLFLHWHVKGFSSNHTARKVEVIGPENTLFAGTSVHLSAQVFYTLQAGVVKGLIMNISSTTSGLYQL